MAEAAPVKDHNAEIGPAGIPVQFVEDTFPNEPPIRGNDEEVEPVRVRNGPVTVLYHGLPRGHLCGPGEPGHLQVQLVQAFGVVFVSLSRGERHEGVAAMLPVQCFLFHMNSFILNNIEFPVMGNQSAFLAWQSPSLGETGFILCVIAIK